MSDVNAPNDQSFVNDIDDPSTPNVEVSDFEKNAPLQPDQGIAHMSYQELDKKVKADEEEKKKEKVVMPLSR